MRELQEHLGYVFVRLELLEEALTHSSWGNEACAGQRGEGKTGEEKKDATKGVMEDAPPGGKDECSRQSGKNEKDKKIQHNERLEFLGDAVLELCVSQALFERFPAAREGDLTRVRAALVNTWVLAELARELYLDRKLRLGRGEESQGGRERAPLLADTFEAVLGAVFLDGGFGAAQRLVARLFERRWPKEAIKPRRKDYKTSLQEATQRLPEEHRGLPLYIPDGFEGPEHACTFAVIVELPDGRRFRATGANRKGAEQEAARLALMELEGRPN